MVRIVKDLDLDLTGRHVLLVEDIIDSGLTLSYLRKTLTARNPASLEVCALLVRESALRVDITSLRYVGFIIPRRLRRRVRPRCRRAVATASATSGCGARTARPLDERGAVAAPATRVGTAYAVAVAVLVVANVVNNRVLPSWSYVPVNLAEAAVLLGIARWASVAWAELGLDRASLGDGLRWGLGAMAAVVATYLVAAAVPGLRGLFADAGAETASAGRMLYESIVRIPLGTVVLEEVAFRACSWASAAACGGGGPPPWSSSLLFGLWHILPAASPTSANEGLEDVTGDLGGGRAAVVLAAVAATFVAGLVLCWLRRRSGSLLAPRAPARRDQQLRVLLRLVAGRSVSPEPFRATVRRYDHALCRRS